MRTLTIPATFIALTVCCLQAAGQSPVVASGEHCEEVAARALEACMESGEMEDRCTAVVTSCSLTPAAAGVGTADADSVGAAGSSELLHAANDRASKLIPK